ncbi:molybdenum cofactor biosynthesis protein MoaE [Gulosibacter bifidus]|uniref:Molybdenum cofactor biosynthesis protein MoaE n=1 Tax=Gulosibacter bifidus TaxID=272239 RepID=A0ABW5RKS0_9MICO|nr:molybdenum cofactor biosynthesis protein MoaE [Gulosibacter bifidus]
MTVDIAAISETALALDPHLRAVEHATAGAIATFVGTVRDHDPDASGEVTLLEYSCHPDAERVLANIAHSLDRDDVRIAVSHRIGALNVGDSAIIACVSSAHRAEAFDICRELVERIKHEVPIWKRQHAADGTTNWQGISAGPVEPAGATA